MKKSSLEIAVPVEIIQNKIYLIRGQKVMLDRDLAELYGVLTSNLNKAVRRNTERFPLDFAFTLTKDEFQNLMFQFGTSSWGGTRKLPYVFTEQGVAMLSSVLNSTRAIQVNIQIMRIFTKLREVLATNKELARKFSELESRVNLHDKDILSIFEAIRKLMMPSPIQTDLSTAYKRTKAGFITESDSVKK